MNLFNVGVLLNAIGGASAGWIPETRLAGALALCNNTRVRVANIMILLTGCEHH